MSARSYLHSRSGSRDGIALVMVLAFIVLLTILIVSFIAFTRLNRASTASYSKSIQAQEIAQGGIEDILGDLHQEIIAGSTVYNTNSSGTAYTNSLATVYVPTTNFTAQPARLGYAAASYGNDVTSTLLPPTLVRVSRASQDATPTDLYPPLSTLNYPGTLPLNRASAANSSTTSASGRSISAARWNKISLLSTNGTIPAPFSANTPDWVYVTRTGSRVCSVATDTIAKLIPSSNLNQNYGTVTPGSNPPASPVIGRYAYAVYDEGALLDINTVGFVSNAGNTASGFSTNAIAIPSVNNPGSIAQNISSKSYLAYADLTQLPGLANAQTAIVDPLIQWRNASVAMGTASTAATNYFQMVFTNAKTGFLNFQSNGTGTDSPVLGRQSLINYFAKIDPTGTTYSAALPFLGTFSRANNAPSWNPTANAANLPGYYGLSSTVASYTFVHNYTPSGGAAFTVFNAIRYKDNAEQTLDVDGSTDQGGSVLHVANRDIPNVRYPSTQTITHYNDDGTSSTYTVNAGDPVVQHRFSLAKLAWLTPTGPAAGISAQAIQDCFGLAWDPQSLGGSVAHYDRWDYVAATTSDVHILSLDEIAAGCTATANPKFREPNFFELLKAGILSGSLGQSPGPTASTTYEGCITTNFDTVSSERNRHILQIGANIIDQANSASVPTAIYLAMFGVLAPATSQTTESDLTSNTVFGDENLPGVYLMSIQAVEDWVIASPLGTHGDYKTWLIPELWNIHQPPANGIDTSVAGTPGYPRPIHFRVHAYGEITSNCNIATTQADAPINYDSTAPYSYHDASSGPVLSAGSSPPTGTVATIPGGESPPTSGTAPPSSNSASDKTSPASLIYFTDTATAASPFYRYPSYLQSLNLYSNGLSAFAGTNPLNLSTPNYDTQLPDDYDVEGSVNPPVATSGNYHGIQFAAIFSGENPTLPNMLPGPVIPPATTPPGPPSIQYSLAVTEPLYLSLECQDPTTLKWHPYSFLSRINVTTVNQSGDLMGDDADGYAANYIGTPGTTGSHAANGRTTMTKRGDEVVHADPRTDRFSIIKGRISEDAARNTNVSLNPKPGTTYWLEDNFPWRTWGFVYNPDQGGSPGVFGSGGANYPSAWAVNSTAGAAYYVDQDGVVRPGDSYRQNTTTGDGALLYSGTGGSVPDATPDSTPDGTGSLLPTSTGVSPTGSAQARRPVILNRPFRSVGELGYTFRDLPFKTLDFFSKYSADGALLDLFSVTDEPAVAAGEVNASNAPASVLKAVFVGATKMSINDPPQALNFMSSTEANKIATSLATSLQTQPLNNRADLVKALDPVITPLCTGPVQSNPNYANKAYAEGPIRALSAVTNTRTWNLLVDIIAQSGHLTPTAATLDNFVVEGEKRYWLHIAIDRYTGKIIDQQLEAVYE